MARFLLQDRKIINMKTSGDNAGTVLKLDDLAFSGGDVGIEEFEKMSVDMYPNPSSDVVFIKSEGNYSYEIFNVAGQLVESKVNIDGATQVDVSNWNTGAYIVHITNGNAKEIKKLIVE